MQSLEDAQDRYILQKYTLGKYTLEKYTLGEHTLRKYTLGKYTLRKYTLDKYTLRKYTFRKYTFRKGSLPLLTPTVTRNTQHRTILTPAVKKYDQRSYGMTWVGARDTCMSKKTPCMNIFMKRYNGQNGNSTCF